MAMAVSMPRSAWIRISSSSSIVSSSSLRLVKMEVIPEVREFEERERPDVSR
jgi:hypothetical protein